MTKSTHFRMKNLSEDAYPLTWQVLRSGVETGVAPGVVAGLWSKKEPDCFFIAALGNRCVLPAAMPMLPDTVFDLSSVSKVFGTATLAAMLVERKWIDWDTEIGSFFQQYLRSGIRVRHLLGHTAGFSAWEPFWQKMRHVLSVERIERVPVEERQRAMRDVVLNLKLLGRPGEHCVYSDISFLILGFVLEEVTQMPLDRAVKTMLWDSMGIEGAFYKRVTKSVNEDTLDVAAATENCPWRGGVLQGQVHDDNCWAMGGYGGHAGAFASAREILHFSKRLMMGFLTKETLNAMWSRIPEPPGCERTLGWDTPSGSDSATGRSFSPSSVGHLGFTGTSLWIDPGAEIAVVLLTNRVHPSRDNMKIKGFRPRFHDALRDDLARNIGN
ncbi:MAG: serine hydrolase domain-containing protein [Bdellovibrionota bacterium]